MMTLDAKHPASQCPSVLVIILDALRTRNVSCYGDSEAATPYLNAFAEDNVLFKRAYTTSTWTIPTHASMLSGLYLSQHRIENIERDRRFSKSIVPLPEALRSVGYRTAAFSQNPLFSPLHHFDYFDEFYGPEDLFGSEGGMPFGAENSGGSSSVLDRLVQYWQKMKRPRKLFDALVDWIQFRGPGTPFFLMTNVLNVHYPWAPPPFPLLKRLRFNPRHLLQSEFVIPKPFSFNSGKKRITPLHRAVWHSLYEAAVEHVDREVGRFLRLLRQIEGGEDVIVVITSDHGEMLGDRGLVGHTLSLHDNILHVPLIIQHPGWPSGLTIEGVVQTVDLYSSVVDWAGVPLETIPSAQLQRSSYSDAVASPDSLSGYAFAEEDYTESYNVIEGLLSVNPDMDPHRYPRRQVAVHSANHKYIWYDDRPAAFYDLRTDPLEERNLLDSSEQVSVVEDLRQALGHWRERLDLFPPRGVDDRVEADEEVVRRLRNLGYIA